MAQIEIGLGKSARRAYHLDDVSIVTSRRTRDADDVDTGWQLDAFGFEVPLVTIGGPALTGALNVIDAEAFRSDSGFDAPALTAALADVNEGGGVSAVAVRPQRAEELLAALGRAEFDLLVIRGRVVSAEHVSKAREPLNLKKAVRALEVPVIVGACSSFQAALHLMRTGAARDHRCQRPGERWRRGSVGDRHRRCSSRPHAAPRRDRGVRASHRRGGGGVRRRGREGDRLRR